MRSPAGEGGLEHGFLAGGRQRLDEVAGRWFAAAQDGLSALQIAMLVSKGGFFFQKMPRIRLLPPTSESGASRNSGLILPPDHRSNCPRQSRHAGVGR
ncbi:MAG: hypothetical protein M5U09_04725 [Gammaproteobacteria bacterium]|nr:hypothetical protein [Gammaproteobacteria bacterium]